MTYTYTFDGYRIARHHQQTHHATSRMQQKAETYKAGGVYKKAGKQVFLKNVVKPVRRAA